MQELADKANISRVSVSIWERGVREPDEKYIRLLARTLNIHVNEISDLEPEYETSKLELSEFTDTWLSFIEKDNIYQDRINDMIDGIKILNTELNHVKVILRALMSSLSLVLYLKDKKLKYITANDAFFKNLSLLSTFRVLGKKDQDFFPVREAKENEEEDYQIILSGKAIVNKECFIPGTRRSMVGLKSKIPVFDSKGDIIGLLVLFTDITEKKKIEAKNLLLEDVLDNIATGIWFVEIVNRARNKYKLRYLNRVIEKICGYSREVLYRNPKLMYSIFTNETLQEFGNNFMREKKYPIKYNYQITSVSGAKVDIEETVYCVNEKYLVGIFNDVTEINSIKKNKELLFGAGEALNKTILWGGIFDRDRKDIIFNFASDNVKDITGYSSAFIKAEKMSILDFVPSQFHNLYYSWMDRIDSNPVFEHWLQNKNGELTWCETRITVKDKEGVLSCIGTSTALEKDDKAKKELMESQQITTAFYVKEKTIEIAKNMKAKRLDSVIISELTGLNIDEIHKL